VHTLLKIALPIRFRDVRFILFSLDLRFEIHIAESNLEAIRCIPRKKYTNAQKRKNGRYEATYTDSKNLQKNYAGMFDTAKEAHEASIKHRQNLGIQIKTPTSRYRGVWKSKNRDVFMGERKKKMKSGLVKKSGRVKHVQEEVCAVKLEVNCHKKGFEPNDISVCRALKNFMAKGRYPNSETDYKKVLETLSETGSNHI